MARLAREEGIVLRTAQRWLRRYREYGLAGLMRAPRADRGSRIFPPDLVRLIEGLAGANSEATSPGRPNWSSCSSASTPTRRPIAALMIWLGE